MKWEIDPSFDPLQDLQDLKEKVQLLEMVVGHMQRTQEQLINTIQMQNHQIEGYRRQNLQLINLLNRQQQFIEAK